jgi:hypothetical protein
MINKDNITIIRQKLQAALNEAGKEFNLTISLGSIKYGNFDFTFKGIARMPEDDSEKQLWNENCGYFSLVANDYKRIVTIYGKPFKLIGFKIGRKSCILGKGQNGKTYRLPPSDVVSVIGKINLLLKNQ